MFSRKEVSQSKHTKELVISEKESIIYFPGGMSLRTLKLLKYYFLFSTKILAREQIFETL